MDFLTRYRYYKDLIMEGNVKSLIPNIQYSLIGDKSYRDLSDDDKQQLQIDIDNQIKIISNKVDSITSNIQYQSWIYDVLKNKDKNIFEDFEVIKSAITDFENLSKRPDLKPEEKDIQTYKTFQDLQKFILQFQNAHRQNKNIYDSVFKQVYKNSSYTMYLINKNQYKECNLFFGGIDLDHYFNTGWCVAKNESYFDDYINDSPDDNNGYIVWIKNSDNKPHALLHVGSCQFKDTSDDPIEDKSPDILDGLFKLVNFEKYNLGDFKYYYKFHMKDKYPYLTDLEILFKLNNVKYNKETNTVDLQNKKFRFKDEYLNSEGTFDFKFINWPTDCSEMFYNCLSLIHLPDTFTISNGVINCSSMFSGCISLTKLPDTFTISNGVTDCSNMFNGCKSLSLLPINFTISNTIKSCSKMFSGCDHLTLLPEGFTIPNSVVDCSEMFSNCRLLIKLPNNFTISESVANCYCMFSECVSLHKLPNNFTIPKNVINCQFMFSNCESLNYLSDDFKISNKATDCSYMFLSCESLTQLPENFTIPNGGVANYFCMFSNCKSLTKLPINFKISSKYKYSKIFNGCTALKDEYINEN